MIVQFSDAITIPPHDFCIVGAGPAGIALALRLADRGHRVLLLESGGEKPEAFTGSLSGANLVDERVHAPMTIASCRALGGTSWWWGGRCVPFDAADFADRPHAPGADWPITYEEIERWHPEAAAFFAIGGHFFEKEAGLTALTGTCCNTLERWSPQPNVSYVYKRDLERDDRIMLLLGATVTALQARQGSRQITAVTLADRTRKFDLPVKNCTLACGGLETTRLLLLARQHCPWLFEASTPSLGKFYMGHISGKIADIVFNAPETAETFDFFLENGAFARRRFTFDAATLRQFKLLNIAFWVDNPPFHDSAHRSSILSAVWLALATPFLGRRLLAEAVRLAHVGPPPFRFRQHIGNIVRSPFSLFASLSQIIKDRFFTNPRKPGFLIKNAVGRYALHYHAEHIPSPFSRVTLSEDMDALGVPKLTIDLRFSDQDADSVIRAHELLDQFLRKSQLGHLEYRFPKEGRLSGVLSQASDGFHQIGTTRMSGSPDAGIVNSDCKVHGIDNLYILSSSVFPSSGQANPTFLIVALAHRLASHLASNIHSFEGI